MINTPVSLVLALASVNAPVACEPSACEVVQPVAEAAVQGENAVAAAQPIAAPDASEPQAETMTVDGQLLDDDAPLEEGGPPVGTVEEQAAEEGAGPAEGQIVVTGNAGPPKGDPAEEINVAAFETVQKIDDAVVAPVADAYDKGIPKPLRSGLRNFLRNLGEPVNFLNFMLQLKVGKAFETLGRFAINSTVGVAGLVDVAKRKPFNLPYRPNGFANTLGFYGVGPGPYLYLPFIGSTTVRDLFGRTVDLAVLPYTVGAPFNNPLYSIPIASLNSLETRIIIDDQIRVVRDECGDPYAGTRDIYLITRQIEIDTLRGKESKQLADLVERLSLNCDIEAIRAVQTDLLAAEPDQGEVVTEGVQILDTTPAEAATQPAEQVDTVDAVQEVEAVQENTGEPAMDHAPAADVDEQDAEPLPLAA